MADTIIPLHPPRQHQLLDEEVAALGQLDRHLAGIRRNLVRHPERVLWHCTRAASLVTRLQGSLQITAVALRAPR